jgi:hypothetical protein
LVSEPSFDMMEQRLDRMLSTLESMEERLKKQLDEMMAALSIQFQKSRAKDPSHTSSSQVISLSSSPLEKIPEKQPTKETTNPPPCEQSQPQTQTQTTTALMSFKDPRPTIAQKKDQPPRSPQTHTFSLSSPPKLLPSLPINKSNHHPQHQTHKPQSPATPCEISSISRSLHLKANHCQPQNKRTKPKPKKPPKGHHCFSCYSPPQINPLAQPIPKIPPKTQGKGTSLPKTTKQTHPSRMSSHHRRQHNHATNHAASPRRQHRQTARAPLPSPRSPHNNLPAQQKRRKRRLVFVGSRKKWKKKKGKLVIYV